MRMEVRCCCQPQKLLGTIEVPDGTKAETLLHFPLTKNVPLADWFAATGPASTKEAFEEVRLYTDVWCGQGRRVVAVKAEGVGLDVLRRIPTFVEAVGWHNLPKELTIEAEHT